MDIKGKLLSVSEKLTETKWIVLRMFFAPKSAKNFAFP
jgi:hypothetical protein